MSEKLKEFSKTPQGKLILALGCLALVWIVLLLQFSGDLLSFIPSTESIESNKRDITTLEEQNRSLKAQEKIFKDLNNRYQTQFESYWDEGKHGKIDTELRSIVQKASTTSTLKLNTLGSVRTSQINDQLFYAEIDITSSGTLEVLTNFMAEIDKNNPELSWKRIELRPERKRGGPQQQAATTAAGTTTTTEVQNMTFNGTIRLICIKQTTKEEEKK